MKCRLSSIAGLTIVFTMLMTFAGATRSAPSAASNDSAFGVNSHIASRYPDPARLQGPADAVSQTRAGWAREDFQFYRIEPQDDAYEWEFHDNAVNLLTARGVNIIGLLNGPTPGWAAQGQPSNDFYPPNADKFAEFAGAVVARYKDRVRYWEVWNEPDNDRYWKTGPSAAAYASLLKAVYPAIKAADPNAQVLAAGLVSPEPATSFLQEMANNGAWGSFDVVSLHPYTDPKSPEAGQIGSAGAGQVRALVERLGNKPIWATEYGWSTQPGDRGGNVVSEDEQANYLVRGAVLLRAAGVERVLWYNLKDTQSGDGLGLLRYGSGAIDYRSQKPSYRAFTTLNQQLAGTTPAGTINFGQQTTIVDFENFGTWQRGNQANGTLTQTGAQKHSGGAAAQLSYNFSSGSNDYVVFNSGEQPTISGAPSQIGIWVLGDGSGHALKLWLRDAEGETLQFRLGFVGGGGWQFLATPVSGQAESYNRISGSGNLRLDFPARLVAIVLDDEPDSFSGSGTIYLDDLTAVTGPEAYGARFTKGGGVVDVIWAPSVTQVTVPTNSATGTRVEIWGETKTENASNGQFVFAVGPNPIFLSHTPGQGSTQPPPSQPPSGDERCFPETGYCISGRIREYWEQNGGLPVFGYPVTPQRAETIEGQSFQTQWFERNRLELHPENARPYDVLLGRLGDDLLRQGGRDWTQFPTSQPQDGCRYFPETQHNVCGEILAAWRANGLEFDGQAGKSEAENLALFGLPLSEPQTEIIEGKPYTVQWFERARFELHPENAPPYNVLLGLLGNETLGRP